MDLKYMEICVGNSKYYPHTGAKVVKFEDTTVESELKEIVNETYPIVEATGTNTYIGSTARITKLSKGTRCTLFVENDATGNCTLYINTYGAKNIKDSFGSIVNNLKANVPYNLCYNGTDFILQGKGGGGNATPDKLLIDSTATVDSGPISGTMPNQGAKTANINCGGSYIIPPGYHNGSGKVIANSLASQTSGNATSAQILPGYSAWVNGNKINGNAVVPSLRFIPGTGYTLFTSSYSQNGKFTWKNCIEATVYNQGGTVTVSHDIVAGDYRTVKTCIYVNDVKYGNEHVLLPSEPPQSYTEHVDISAGDKIQLYIDYTFTNYSTATFYIKNFTIQCSNPTGFIK